MSLPCLISWLLLLFYLLATTASDFFSCTLEQLSDVLHLSPALAGVTLLAIGNGAPDVFASIAAFLSSGDAAGSIGFSSVLGGALFVTTIVAGTVALAARSKEGSVRIHLASFVRDAVFLLASSSVLTVILVDAKVQLWEAIAFLSIYAAYMSAVWAGEVLQARYRRRLTTALDDPLLEKSRC